MNILRTHATASTHFGVFISALLSTLKSWIGQFLTFRQVDEGDLPALKQRPRRDRQILVSRHEGKPRILDARGERAQRRSLRNLLI